MRVPRQCSRVLPVSRERAESIRPSRLNGLVVESWPARLVGEGAAGVAQPAGDVRASNVTPASGSSYGACGIGRR